LKVTVLTFREYYFCISLRLRNKFSMYVHSAVVELEMILFGCVVLSFRTNH